MLQVGDAVRFVKTGITGKITGRVKEEDGERFNIEISPDDIGLIGLNLDETALPVISSIPVDMATNIVKI